MGICIDGAGIWPSVPHPQQNSNNKEFCTEVLEDSLLSIKKHFDASQKGFNEFKDRDFLKYRFTQKGSENFVSDLCISYVWNIDNDCQNWEITYRFYNSTQIFDVFDEARKNDTLKECFGKNFPSLFVYSYLGNELQFVFSTNNNFSAPSKDEYIKAHIDNMPGCDNDIKDLKTFMKYKDKKVLPLWKKKHFKAGQKYYNNTFVIDNTKQDKLNKFSDLQYLNIEK